MTTNQCLNKPSCPTKGKFSPRKFLKLVQVAKPVLKLLRRKRRTNAVTPSSCNYDVVESVQNEANEIELFRFDFKFFDESRDAESEENMKNEELERRLTKSEAGEKLGWAPASDLDVCGRGGECLTSRQRAERQVPTPVA